jgi:hypothetical protein
VKENLLLALLFILLGSITLYNSISNISDYFHGIKISHYFKGFNVEGKEALFQDIVSIFFAVLMLLLAYTYVKKKDNKTLEEK